MRTVSICLTVMLLVFTLMSLYEIYEIPKDWNSPLIPKSLVVAMQQSYIVYAVFNFVYFLPSFYISFKGKPLASFKVLAIFVLLYITSFFAISYIRVNG